MMQQLETPAWFDDCFSVDAFMHAWRSVRHSGAIPGRDGRTATDFELRLKHECRKLSRQILAGIYQPQPVLRYTTSDAMGRCYPANVWSVQDRLAQQVVFEALQRNEALRLPYTEELLDRIFFVRKNRRRWVLRTQLIDWLDAIPLPKLMDMIVRRVSSPIIRELLRTWLTMSVDRQPLVPAGLTQGSVLTPLLANLYLSEFDELLESALPDAIVVRYEQNLLIFSEDEVTCRANFKTAVHTMETFSLTPDMSQSQITNFDKGFQFIGHDFFMWQCRQI